MRARGIDGRRGTGTCRRGKPGRKPGCRRPRRTECCQRLRTACRPPLFGVDGFIGLWSRLQSTPIVPAARFRRWGSALAVAGIAARVRSASPVPRTYGLSGCVGDGGRCGRPGFDRSLRRDPARAGLPPRGRNPRSAGPAIPRNGRLAAAGDPATRRLAVMGRHRSPGRAGP